MLFVKQYAFAYDVHGCFNGKMQMYVETENYVVFIGPWPGIRIFTYVNLEQPPT